MNWIMIYTSVSQPKLLRDPFFSTTYNFWTLGSKKTVPWIQFYLPLYPHPAFQQKIFEDFFRSYV